MTLSVPPMLPEDRKHCNVPPMPTPGMCFRKDGRIWKLIGFQEELYLERTRRILLEFIAVDSVNPVNPV